MWRVRIVAHIVTIALGLLLFLGGPLLAHVNVGALLAGGTDLVSSATTIQAAPDGRFYILINGTRHPDKKVLADWVTFFEDKEAAPLIMEDVSCVVCEGDAPGLDMATSLQSRLAENQMKLRTEQGVLAVSKAEAGLFDVLVVSEAAYDNYGVQSIADRDDVVVIER